MKKKNYRHRDWITNSLCEKAVSIWEHEKSSYHFPLDLIRIGSHLHCALSLPSIRLAIHFHPRLQRLSAFFKLTHKCLFSSRKDDVLWFHWDNERSEWGTRGSTMDALMMALMGVKKWTKSSKVICLCLFIFHAEHLFFFSYHLLWKPRSQQNRSIHTQWVSLLFFDLQKKSTL